MEGDVPVVVTSFGSVTRLGFPTVNAVVISGRTVTLPIFGVVTFFGGAFLVVGSGFLVVTVGSRVVFFDGVINLIVVGLDVVVVGLTKTDTLRNSVKNKNENFFASYRVCNLSQTEPSSVAFIEGVVLRFFRGRYDTFQFLRVGGSSSSSWFVLKNFFPLLHVNS